MIYLMILISKENIDGCDVKYYDGIDFDMINTHPRDGSSGFIIFFVDSFISEVNIHNRAKKIDSILNGSESKHIDIENIDNDFICIYQTNGMTEQIFDTIKKNIHSKIYKPWKFSTL